MNVKDWGDVHNSTLRTVTFTSMKRTAKGDVDAAAIAAVVDSAFGLGFHPSGFVTTSCEATGPITVEVVLYEKDCAGCGRPPHPPIVRAADLTDAQVSAIAKAIA